MVASTSRATSMPIPIIFMNTIPLVEKPPMTTASSSAAEVMIRPVFCTPTATARELRSSGSATVDAVRSHYSRTRLSRKTS